MLPNDDGSRHILGDHGYDNRAESMHPIFYAFGPAFRQIDRAKSFRNVDLYPLMSYLLGVPIRPTNGSLDNVKHILVDFPPGDMSNLITRLKTWLSVGFLGKKRVGSVKRNREIFDFSSNYVCVDEHCNSLYIYYQSMSKFTRFIL